jgi:hypothetical protein
LHIALSCYFSLGNEVHIIVNTDTEYEKRDKNNHYGIKCQLIGYEWSNDTSQV